MKKKYSTPTIEVTVLDTDNLMNDIIRVSGVINDSSKDNVEKDDTGNHDIDAKEHTNSWSLWEDDDYEDYQ